MTKETLSVQIGFSSGQLRRVTGDRGLYYGLLHWVRCFEAPPTLEVCKLN